MCVIALVSALFALCLLSYVESRLIIDKTTLPGCVLARTSQDTSECSPGGECMPHNFDQSSKVSSSETIFPRIVAVGDIHGSYNGLLENLFYANITTSKTKCEWKHQDIPTIVVQMGDYVDRGAGALDALRCMRDLQTKASAFKGEVVRIVGNHELWWLTGIYYKRHKVADTRQRVETSIRLIVEDILNGNMVAAKVIRHRNNIPIMFVHAGYNNNFLNYLYNTVLDDNSPESIAQYTNRILRETTSRCPHFPCNLFNDEVFEAGPDRGGSGIGGPLWTDFGTLEDAALQGNSQKNFVQVVGHTMAFCYDPRYPEVHPPDSQAECSLGLIRSTVDLTSLCVDGGMYLGARAFLEIGSDGHVRAFERRGVDGIVPWKTMDYTSSLCSMK